MAEDELTIESIKAQLAAVEKRVREKREKVAAGIADDEPEKSQERLQAEGTVKLLTTKLQNLERSVEVATGEEAPVESVLDWYSAKISETKEELGKAQKLLDDLVVAEEHAATKAENDRIEEYAAEFDKALAAGTLHKLPRALAAAYAEAAATRDERKLLANGE